MAKGKKIKHVSLDEIVVNNKFFIPYRLNKLRKSIAEHGYDPIKFNTRIILWEWHESLESRTPIITILNKKGGIFDGNHRVKVLKEMYPPDKKVEVEIRYMKQPTMYLIYFFFLLAGIFAFWVVFSSWWTLLIAVVLGVGINLYRELKKKKEKTKDDEQRRIN